jgi:hypothetical protein
MAPRAVRRGAEGGGEEDIGWVFFSSIAVSMVMVLKRIRLKALRRE